MHWTKPGFSLVVVGIWLAVLVLEGVLLFREWRRASQAVATLAQKTQERGLLARLLPSPSEENLAAMRAADVATTEAQSLRQAGWRHSEDGKDNPPPGTSVDSLIALSQLHERLRTRAAHAGVLFRANERFGFEAYVNVGPPPELLTDIDRQQREVEILVTALLASEPRELLGLKIENLESSRQAATSTRDDASSLLPGQRSSRQEGMVETDIMQIEFIGSSATLRHFICLLVVSPTTVIMRTLAVEPLTEPHTSPATIDRDTIEEMRPRFSRIKLTVEFPRLVGGVDP